MYNCIFSGHCVEVQCDKSCPILAQTSYLLDRNEISMNSPVFKMGKDEISKYSKILEESQGKIKVISEVNTSLAADYIVYCAICNKWKGSQLHCNVYNLKFSRYIEQLQKSWGYNADSTEVEYVKIWANTANILIISSLDYVNFKDFQSQTLLSLLQSRTNTDLTTIVVAPPLSNLVGDGPFFSRLTEVLSRQKAV